MNLISDEITAGHICDACIAGDHAGVDQLENEKDFCIQYCMYVRMYAMYICVRMCMYVCVCACVCVCVCVCVCMIVQSIWSNSKLQRFKG